MKKIRTFYQIVSELLPFQWLPLNLMKIRHIARDLVYTISLTSEWHFVKTFFFKIGLETNLE